MESRRTNYEHIPNDVVLFGKYDTIILGVSNVALMFMSKNDMIKELKYRS